MNYPFSTWTSQTVTNVHASGIFVSCLQAHFQHDQTVGMVWMWPVATSKLLFPTSKKYLHVLKASGVDLLLRKAERTLI